MALNTAIRYLKKGEWQKAHEIAQHDERLQKLGSIGQKGARFDFDVETRQAVFEPSPRSPHPVAYTNWRSKSFASMSEATRS